MWKRARILGFPSRNARRRRTAATRQGAAIPSLFGSRSEVGPGGVNGDGWSGVHPGVVKRDAHG
jgi:hypothetical protein